MDAKSKSTIIKACTAVLCTAAMCATIIASAGKMSDALVKEAEAAPQAVSVEAQAFESETAAPAESSSATEYDVPVDAGTQTEDAADNTSAETAEAPSADTTAEPAAAPAKAQQSSSGNTTVDPLSTTEGIVNYCNKALNSAKAAKPGYTKTFVREIKGSNSGVSPIIAKVIKQNKTTTMKKGDDCTDDFPAGGYSWSSKLRPSDLRSAECKKNGAYYDITLKLKNEKNPAKGEASSYGRVMTVIDAAEASKMVPGVKDVNMDYHDGYVFARIDAKTGRLVKAEFSATADISASLLGANISAKNVVSTETFTNFIW
ncbi:MAG: hypothetical protein IJT03_04450 [Clostridia bacterium]|nr:hypothetical protein [Clostridia bacterium]